MRQLSNSSQFFTWALTSDEVRLLHDGERDDNSFTIRSEQRLQ